MRMTASHELVPYSVAAIFNEELESLRKALHKPIEQLSMRLVICDDSQWMEALVQELATVHQASVVSISDSVNDPVLECKRQTSGAKPQVLFVKGMELRDDFTPLLQCLEKSDFERWHSHFPASTIVFWLSSSLLKAIHEQATSFRNWCIKEHILVQKSSADQNVDANLTPWDRSKTSNLTAWERMSRLAHVERRLLKCASGTPEHDGFVIERLMIYLQMGRFDAVLHYLPSHLASCTSKTLLRSFNDLAGLAHIGLCNGSEALKKFSTALSIANKLEDVSSIALEKGHLALAYFALNQLKRAKNCYLESIKLWSKCSNSKMAQIDMANFASIQHREGNTDHLPASYENALLAAEDSDDLAAQIHILNLLGTFCLECAQNKKALELHRRALVISNRIGNGRGTCTSLMYLGRVYACYTNFREAEKHYIQALIASSEYGDRRSSGLVMCHLGLLYEANGMSGKAIGCYRYGEDVLGKIGDIMSKEASKRARELEKYIT